MPFRRTVAAVCLVVVAAVAVAAKKPKWDELESYTYERYVSDFKKPHVTEARRRAFEANMAQIKRINGAKLSWKAGVNMFTDMTPQEFKAYNRYKRAPGPRTPSKVHAAPMADEVPLPKTVDWRSDNAAGGRVLTAVKHQGSCGSCWAHSAAQSIEAQYALLTGMLPVLSVAQINSCTPSTAPYYCAGCDGGDHIRAWQYLADKSVQRPTVLQAVTENWAYPIPIRDWFFDTQKNYTTSKCRDISTEWETPTTAWFAELTAAGVSGYGQAASNSPTGGPAAMKVLRDVGPQSISIAAGNWQWYETGIFQNTDAAGLDNEWQVDHAVQMVGYGFDKGYGMNYWIVRNSWSTLWGEDGYIRLWRANDGEKEPCSPASFGPVCGTSGVLNEVAYPIVYEAKPTKFG